MSDPIPKSEFLARRTIDAVYRHYGRAARYYSDESGQWVDVVVIARVQDYEEDISGSEMEFSRRGFQMRFQAYALEENHIVLCRAGKIELLAPFQGHKHFHIDSDPVIYGRVGLQWICGVTPSANNVVHQNPKPIAQGSAGGYTF